MFHDPILHRKVRKLMTSKKDSRYDIPPTTPSNTLGGSQGWAADLAHGHEGEALVADFLRAVTAGSFEVKSDRWRNGRMVVEMSQNPRGSGWKPSGLAITEAMWWCYIYTTDGAMTIVAVPRLKRFVATLPKTRIKSFMVASDNPTKGFLLLPDEITDLMINPAYDA